MSICAPGVGAPLSCNIPGWLGFLDGAHGLGVGLGKLVRVGLGRLLKSPIPIPKAHSQSPSPMPIPNPHTHPSPQCPYPILIPIPKPNSRCPSQLPIPNAHPQSPSRISASCRVGGGMENLMDFCCHTGGLARGCHAVLRGGCRLGQPPSAQEGGMEAGCHAPNHPPPRLI